MNITYLVKSIQNKKLYMRMNTYFALILDIDQDIVDISHLNYTAHTYWTRAGISLIVYDPSTVWLLKFIVDDTPNVKLCQLL